MKKETITKTLCVIGIIVFVCFMLVYVKRSINVVKELLVPAKVLEVIEVDRLSFPVAQDIDWVIATAYSSDVAQTDDTPCIPADGYNLCEHYEKYGEGNTVAANFLPLGTQVKIPELYGDKIFVVHDRMNRRYYEGRIDIWMPTREEAIKFGIKRLRVEYLK